MTPPEGMDMPDGMENMFLGQNSFAPAQGGNQWGLIVVIIVILAVGLLFAVKFKR